MTDLPSLLAALEAAPAGSRELDASPMPCISLWQPYASLIACGAKPFETRHWAAPARFIGQRVAIHAAARKPSRDTRWTGSTMTWRMRLKRPRSLAPAHSVWRSRLHRPTHRAIHGAGPGWLMRGSSGRTRH